MSNGLADSLEENEDIKVRSETIEKSQIPEEKRLFVKQVADMDNDYLNPKRDRSGSVDSGTGDYEVDLETGLEVISLDEVSYHCTIEDGWMVIYDKVYDVTEYLEGGRHPGGEDVMMEYLGYDATMAFRGVGHSKGALRMLEKYVVGILPVDERLNFRSDF